MLLQFNSANEPAPSSDDSYSDWEPTVNSSEADYDYADDQYPLELWQDDFEEEDRLILESQRARRRANRTELHHVVDYLSFAYDERHESPTMWSNSLAALERQTERMLIRDPVSLQVWALEDMRALI